MLTRGSFACRLAGLSVLMLSFSTARVSAEPPAALAQRFAGAQRAVIGKVAAVEPRWERNEWGDTLIVSRLAVDVEESLKGISPRRVVVDVEGGTIDGLTLHVSHQVELRAGDRAVLIINEVRPGVHRPHRKGQGLLKVLAGDRLEDSAATLSDLRAAARSASAR